MFDAIRRNEPRRQLRVNYTVSGVPLSALLDPNDRTSLTKPSASRLDQRRLDTALLYLLLASSERICLSARSTFIPL